MPTTLSPRNEEEAQRIEQLREALRALQLQEHYDFWLVHNGYKWRLRWFEHTTVEQQAQGDTLVNSLLNK